ncbi:hypothetical protein LPH50_02300 [Xylella taiwanensis]|nr:hypothetical protein [Xylella taiwanensis]UFM94145.1 hypothetical protein LPH39_02310 [Xylella taiwanensis]UFN09492.1 hypothetical protein LPH45_02185 [Xylella taiwanensis]UFN14071.1 hypothetical protein LPH61_02155 [Xylella taiwanensis]UFN16382.1 hypothetical protein LPH50_02300 [Xylella taiwanensis]UFN18630.1 hypothetical protein LPH64_02305 [Xylella taiwanensis]
MSRCIRWTLSIPLLMTWQAWAANISGELGLTTQVIDRGIPSTLHTPILQSNLTWLPTPGWALSASSSILVRQPDHLALINAELTRYWSPTDDWQLQTSVLYYGYPGNRFFKRFNRIETSAGISYRDIVTFSVAAFRLTEKNKGTWYAAADLSLRQPLSASVSLTTGIGVSQRPTTFYFGDTWTPPHPYYYGHAGLIWTHNTWTIQFTHLLSSTNSPAHQRNAAISPWIATLSHSF